MNRMVCCIWFLVVASITASFPDHAFAGWWHRHGSYVYGVPSGYASYGVPFSYASSAWPGSFGAPSVYTYPVSSAVFTTPSASFDGGATASGFLDYFQYFQQLRDRLCSGGLGSGPGQGTGELGKRIEGLSKDLAALQNDVGDLRKKLEDHLKNPPAGERPAALNAPPADGPALNVVLQQMIQQNQRIIEQNDVLIKHLTKESGNTTEGGNVNATPSVE